MTGRVKSSLTKLLIIDRYSKVLEQREELEQKHLHLLQILDSERQAKWHYVQQTEELATSVKELRAEVLGRGRDVRNRGRRHTWCYRHREGRGSDMMSKQGGGEESKTWCQRKEGAYMMLRRKRGGRHVRDKERGQAWCQRQLEGRGQTWCQRKGRELGDMMSEGRWWIRDGGEGEGRHDAKDRERKIIEYKHFIW